MQNVKAGKLTFCPPRIHGFVFEAEVTLPGGMGGTERREWGGEMPPTHLLERRFGVSLFTNI